jgi:hypothetical protein
VNFSTRLEVVGTSQLRRFHARDHPVLEFVNIHSNRPEGLGLGTEPVFQIDALEL